MAPRRRRKRCRTRTRGKSDVDYVSGTDDEMDLEKLEAEEA